jgi:hypothetical protein
MSVKFAVTLGKCDTHGAVSVKSLFESALPRFVSGHTHAHCLSSDSQNRRQRRRARGALTAPHVPASVLDRQIDDRKIDDRKMTTPPRLFVINFSVNFDPKPENGNPNTQPS